MSEFSRTRITSLKHQIITKYVLAVQHLIEARFSFLSVILLLFLMLILLTFQLKYQVFLARKSRNIYLKKNKDTCHQLFFLLSLRLYALVRLFFSSDSESHLIASRFHACDVLRLLGTPGASLPETVLGVPVPPSLGAEG